MGSRKRRPFSERKDKPTANLPPRISKSWLWISHFSGSVTVWRLSAELCSVVAMVASTLKSKCNNNGSELTIIRANISLEWIEWRTPDKCKAVKCRIRQIPCSTEWRVKIEVVLEGRRSAVRNGQELAISMITRSSTLIAPSRSREVREVLCDMEGEHKKGKKKGKRGDEKRLRKK